MKYCFLLLFLFLTRPSFSQSAGDSLPGHPAVLKPVGADETWGTISGKVIDKQGDPIPYTNVFINGTSNGTIANYNGDFSLKIKQGQKPEVVFQSLGYKKQHYLVRDTTKMTDIVITMESEHTELAEITINAKAKNRGYEIIRKANAKMKYYDNLLNNYSVDVYIKGTDRLDSIPKKLPAFLKVEDLPDSTDLGLISLSEAVAVYNFKKPDLYKEEMLSSRVAGRKNGLSWDRVGGVQLNFYKNTMYLVDEKPFISPIADGGIVFYKYDLEASFMEDGKKVYKIKVEPRNKAEAVYGGYIYINDETWSIHSLDLYVTKKSGIPFMDSMYVKQTYGIINDSISAPRSVSMKTKYSALGFSASFTQLGSFYNYRFNREFPKKFFRNEVFSVSEDATKKDTTYWSDNRPVVLTVEENRYYVKKDSLIGKKPVYDPYADSVLKKRNRPTLSKLFINGYTYWNNNHSFHVEGLLTNPGYNTVEGLKTEVNLKYTRALTRQTSWFNRNDYYIETKFRYGFSSHKLYALARYGRENYAEQRKWNVAAGSSIHQYNDQNPIIDVVNAGYSLIMRQNFMKLYDKTAVSGEYEDVLKWGPKIKIGAEYAQRNPLQNHEDWYISNKVEDRTTSNNPLNPLSDSLAFKRHQSFVLKFSGQYTFGERYEMIQNYRRIIGSRYPTVYWEFEQGIKGLGADVGFGRYQVGIGKAFNFKYWGKTNVDIIAGGFVNKNSSYFMDYKHFNGNETLILKNGGDGTYDGRRSQLDQFNALSYYGFSTNDNYLELHVQHRFLGLIMTKIPLLSKLHLYEVAGINAVYTSGNRNYQELYAGIENIAKIFRVDFVASYKAHEKIQPMIRIGIKRAI